METIVVLLIALGYGSLVALALRFRRPAPAVHPSLRSFVDSRHGASARSLMSRMLPANASQLTRELLAATAELPALQTTGATAGERANSSQ